MPNFPYDGPSMGSMIFASLAFFILLGGVAFLLFNLLSSKTSFAKTPKSSSPENILKERYAKGEIDEDELEEKLTFLRSDTHSSSKWRMPRN